jgi:hypothetical protein
MVEPMKDNINELAKAFMVLALTWSLMRASVSWFGQAHFNDVTKPAASVVELLRCSLP